jgi:uncharacterized protein
MNVLICWSPAPRQVRQRRLTLPAGSTVGQALHAVGLVVSNDTAVAVWGRLQGMDWALQDQDRVELLQGLMADPMEARRRRHAHQLAAKAKRRLGLSKPAIKPTS